VSSATSLVVRYFQIFLLIIIIFILIIHDMLMNSSASRCFVMSTLASDP
jgi:mannose/fructose/N-acetylgalactosamine-specific phosphotransferase system component IIC